MREVWESSCGEEEAHTMREEISWIEEKVHLVVVLFGKGAIEEKWR